MISQTLTQSLSPTVASSDRSADAVTRPENSVLYNVSSWDRNKALPTIVKPEQAYTHLFGSVAGGEAQKEFAGRARPVADGKVALPGDVAAGTATRC